MPEKKDLTVENEVGKTPVTVADRGGAGGEGKDKAATPDKITGAGPAGNTRAGKQQASKDPGTKALRRKGGFIRRVFVLLVLCGLGAVGYYLYRYGPPENSVVAGLWGGQDEPAPAAKTLPANAPAVTAREDILSTVNALDGRLEEHNARLSADIEALGSRLTELQLQVNSQRSRLQQLSTTSREDWLLAEAEYLLRLANQRILTERQTGNALSLMMAADAILRDLDDTDLFPVRKALAADITKVKMAGIVDREGIYLRLDGLIQAIPELRAPLRETAEEEIATVATQSTDPWYLKLLENARAALIKMSGIVRVERVDVPIAPVMLPSEQQLLHLNLRMALEQTQLALMREEEKIFAASLTRAEELVAGSFVKTRQAAMFREEIRGLSREKITQPLPELNTAVNALQDYIRLWHSRYPVAGQDSGDRVEEAATAAPEAESESGADAGTGAGQ